MIGEATPEQTGALRFRTRRRGPAGGAGRRVRVEPADEELQAEVLAAGRRAGLAAVGVAAVEIFEDTRRHLLERRAEGLAAGMQFTYRNPERSTDPARILPGAASLVVGAMGYAHPGDPEAPFDDPVAAPGARRPAGRVARYATRDHYAELRRALGEMADVLRDAGHRAVVVADDNALVDREAARRAGLGYYGKNSNLLLAGGAGSWFVLGSVVTDAALSPASGAVGDGCGACRRCLDGCPTGAIVAPGVVDARRCLAWLLQDTGDFPEQYREALGDRLYGCDDCGEVCPPNRRTERSAVPAPPDAGTQAFVDVLELLGASDGQLLERHGRWYIPRRDPRYLRRNALVVLGNTADGGDPEVIETLRRYRRGPDTMLARHATWAARRLGPSTEAATAPAVPDEPVEPVATA